MNILFKKEYMILSAFFISLFSLTYEQQSVEDARLHRQELVQKYIKVLKKEEGAIRLVGGQDKYEGNVEILHMGKWGAICDDEWDRNEAEIVCKQLGFKGYSQVTHSSSFGIAKKRFWMDNVLCDGHEKELMNCRFDGWGKNDCDSSEAAGVKCKKLENATGNFESTDKDLLKLSKIKIHKHKMEVRLSGGRVPSEGKVEVQINNGRWGDICSDGWSLLEANVVCKQLGMGFANDALQTDFFGNRSRIVISGTECFGNETELSECVHYDTKLLVLANDPAIHCTGPKNYVAAVSCTQFLPDLDFDYGELEQTAHLEDRQMFYLQCAMEENCVASEAYEIQRDDPAWHLQTRRLLKFTAKVLNSGNIDFRPSIPKHLWEWHMCHMHYHSMEVFAVFDVFDIEGKKVAEGHKASFCLEDNQCKPGVQPKYACANYGDQGISVNCYDIYRYNIDCQWIDISNIEYGDYKLKVAVNPEFKVPEMSFDNNAALCDLRYTQTNAKVYNCKLVMLKD